jgi:predicted HTH transcriptional regulator
MTLLEEIQGGENAALKFKEAWPKESLKFTKTVVAIANERDGRS